MPEEQQPAQGEEPSEPDKRSEAHKEAWPSPAERHFGVEEVTVDPSLPPEVIKDIVRGEKTSANVGRIIGFVIILLGIILLVLGVSGSVDVTFSNGAASGHLVTGAVGVVVVIVGGCVLYFTRYKVTAANPSSGRKGG